MHITWYSLINPDKCARRPVKTSAEGDATTGADGRDVRQKNVVVKAKTRQKGVQHERYLEYPRAQSLCYAHATFFSSYMDGDSGIRPHTRATADA
jgi:hypothetical protein